MSPELRNRAKRFSINSIEDAGDVDEVDHGKVSPTRRKSAGKLHAFIDKLKPSSSARNTGGGGGAADSTDRKASGKSSKGGSGKHTPDAVGDFGEFLKAAELRERLETEQEEEAERELKLAKQRKKKTSSANLNSALAAAHQGKATSPAESFSPALPLEGKKEFPGGFEDSIEAGPSNLKKRQHYHRHHSHRSRQTTGTSSHPGDLSRGSSTEAIKSNKGRDSGILNICGGESISSSESSSAKGVKDEEDEATLLQRDSEGHERVVPAYPDDHASAASILSRSSYSSSGSWSASTSGSGPGDSHDADIALAQQSKPSPWRKMQKDASTRSLKSWDSTNSPGALSLASGGANRKLSAPLLELEELELKSFLKNFNRHTREVRVPASVNFPRRRMPQWEDFRIPAGEAAIAAKEGKKVTVLTHVDRGLQVLAEDQGKGAPPTRATLTRTGESEEPSSSSPKRGLLKRGKAKVSSAANQAGIHGHSSSSAADEEIRHQRVTWAPDTGFIPDGLRAGEDTPDRLEAMTSGLGQQSNLNDKSQRKAKILDELSRNAGTPSSSGSNPFVPPGNISLGGKGPISKGQGGPPGSSTEDANDFRPSQLETDLTEGTWEMIDSEAEHLTEIDASEADRVDGIAFCIAYILALVERYAPEELDNTPQQTYREGRARSHLERLYIIAPFWERLGFGLRRLYRWEDSKRTGSAAMIYFVLWWTDLLPTAFMLMLMYYILQFRFFPPEASYLHEQVRARMSRGVEADKLAERLRRRSRLDVLEIYRRFTAKYGIAVQLAAGDIADFHEKVKNLILWRNESATWRTLGLFAVLTAFVTFCPAYYLWKLFFFFVGFTFFCLLPLQSHYPRYRRPLSPAWWALWGSPTDAQFAIALLRRRHLERAQAEHTAATDKDHQKKGSKGHVKGKSAKVRSEAAHAVKGGNMKPLPRFDFSLQTGGHPPLSDDTPDDENAPASGLQETEDMQLFGLEEEVSDSQGQKKFRPKKLGSYFCQHHGNPGHLIVTTREIYFRGLGGQSKSCKTPLETVAGLNKTKSLRLLVWYSAGLQITRSNKRSLFFSNMVKRDECFNLILAVGSEGEYKGSIDREPMIITDRSYVFSIRQSGANARALVAAIDRTVRMSTLLVPTAARCLSSASDTIHLDICIPFD